MGKGSTRKRDVNVDETGVIVGRKDVSEVAKSFKPLVGGTTFITADELLRRQDEQSFRSGVRKFDEFFGGGLKRGRLYLFFGEPGSGKTSVSIFLAMHALRQGGRVLWISGDVFPGERIRRAAEIHGVADRLNMIDVAMVYSLSVLAGLVGKLSENIEAVRQYRLIVIDDIGAMLRAEGGRENLASRQQLLAKVLATLKTISVLSGAVVIITTEVSANPTHPNAPEQPVGGFVLRHACETIRLRARRESSSSVKWEMQTYEATWAPSTLRLEFDVTDAGIEV